jgi:acyl-CoA reductase-like NAD-dependent aldehyde dehydrogenase
MLLALSPAVATLAAGNRVVLKPGEACPRTSSLLATLVARYFDGEAFAVVEGDRELSKDFAAQSFDLLFFTGSTEVDRWRRRVRTLSP